MLEGQCLGTLEWSGETWSGGPQQWRGKVWRVSKGVVGRGPGAGSWKGWALGAGEERQTTELN